MHGSWGSHGSHADGDGVQQCQEPACKKVVENGNSMMIARIGEKKSIKFILFAVRQGWVDFQE